MSIRRGRVGEPEDYSVGESLSSDPSALPHGGKVRIEVEDEESSASDASDDITEIVSVHIPIRIQSTADLLKICGDSGVWQMMVFLLGAFSGFNCAIQSMIYIFVADIPEYMCSLPAVDQGMYSKEDLHSLLIPMNRANGELEKCERYKSIVEDGRIQSIFTNTTETCNTETIPIEFNISHPNFAETIGTEWNLVCDTMVYLPAVEAIFLVGGVIGAAVFGLVSDKFGRRMAIWISTYMFIVFCPLIGLANNFVTLMIFRFFVGMATPGVFSSTYLLVLECMGSRARSLAGSLFGVPYSLGYAILPVIAYFVRDWRNLQLTCSALTTLSMVTWWFLPESPRWLLVNGKVNKAEHLFREMAHYNGKELPDDFHRLVKRVAACERENVKEGACHRRCKNCTETCCQLMQTPVLRCRVIIISFSFIVICIVYYGIAVSPTNLGFDKYLFTFLCGILEIPIEILLVMFIEKQGRRPVFSGFFFGAGTLFFLALLLARGSVLSMILFVCAQLLIAGNASILYLYASELFPTEMRAYCLGISQILGRTGAIGVPFIVELVGHKNYTIPIIVFGAATLSAACLVWFLPETRHKRLPETVKDVEKRRR